MGFSHDTDDIMRAIQKLQKQLDVIQERTRLFSPENVAHMYGYLKVKDELKEIRDVLANLSRRMGCG